MAMVAGTDIHGSHPRGEFAFTMLSSILLVILVLFLNLPWSPAFTGLGPDSGLYAYVGSSILHGQLPYRDAWEQKPPLGFYLNALAVWLFGRNPWAVWWFDLLWIALCTVAVFLTIKKMMGILPGAIAGIAFVLGVMSPSIFQGGNLMEIYALFPQVLIIACAYFFFTTKRNRWALLGGLAAGFAFMTKQTSIALGLALFLTIIFVSLLAGEVKDLVMRLVSFIAGFLVPLGVALLYWTAAGALGDFMDGVFLHSLIYVGARVSFLRGLRIAFLSAFPKLMISKLYYVAALAFVFYILENYRWFVKRIFPARDKKPLPSSGGISPLELTMLVVFIALPFEIVFASLGGRNFGHYYLALVPSITTVVAYVFWKVFASLHGLLSEFKNKQPWRAIGMMILGLAALAWMAVALVEEAPKAEHLASFPKIFSTPFALDNLEKYVVQNTTRDDAVLVWHVHVGINFITDRRPPQRVLFPANLFVAADSSRSGLAEFLVELENNPPKLILVQKVSSIGLPFVDVPVEQMCTAGPCMPEIVAALKRPEIMNDLQKFRQYFLEHYALETQIYDWLIYKRNQ